MINKILKYKFKYFFSKSKVMVESGGKLEIDSNVNISNSTIYIPKGAYLKIQSNTNISKSSIYLASSQTKMNIGLNCNISNLDFALWNGDFTLGDYSIIENGNNISKTSIDVDGICIIGKYNRIRANIWIRFQGILSIGNRNAINENTEIRADHNVEIGDYNQISYNCTIWDTNTHCFYPAEKRRKLTDEQYPGFGEEIEKPKTSPIKIGNDCWLGKNCSVLKGSKIEDKSIMGYGTLISNQIIPSECTVILKPILKVFKHGVLK